MRSELDVLKLFFISIICSIFLTFFLSSLGSSNDLALIMLDILIALSLVIIYYSSRWRYGLRAITIILSTYFLSLMVLVLFPPFCLDISPSSLNECICDEMEWPSSDAMQLSMTNLGRSLKDISISLTGMVEDDLKSIQIEPNAIEKLVGGENKLIAIKFRPSLAPHTYKSNITIRCADGKKSIIIPIVFSVNSSLCPEAWSKKGDALLELGLYEKAIISYERSLYLDPDFKASWLGKGKAYSHLGNFSEANKAYGRVIALDPENEEVLQLQSILLLASGQCPN
ncbi:MAG: Tetratricopeptide repeat protein [Methanosaeta sp. PtaU1.Bin112]|nr:MAG: Tetratricopeptide repeat protein [Methanosaeta sp. PtaU1.Bin112]